MDPITFALSTTHLAFAIKAPHLNPATHTREDVYILPLSHPTSRPTHLTPHDHGAISGLTFSPDGKKLAWLEMAQDGYESDKRVLVVHDSEETMKWTQAWDRSPHSVVVSLVSPRGLCRVAQLLVVSRFEIRLSSSGA